MLRIFQVMVVARALLALLWQFIPYIWWPNDPLIDKLLRYNAFDNLVGTAGQPLQTAFLLGILASCLGLFFIQNWGRYLFLWLIGLLWVGSLLSGMFVLVPAYSFVFIAIQTLNGAILAIAFSPPLGAIFREQRGF
jgi:hypothetical protein